MIIKSEGGEGELVEEHAIMVSGCFLHCCVFMRYVESWISFES
jgi:WD40 repeat protein